MAPMTRSRAINNIPNDIMAKYYAQRSGAGLIVAEGTSPLPEGLGYSRIPGIYSPEQVEGWKKVTEAVHANNGRIFLQLMHTGRVGHNDNVPNGLQIIGVSDIPAAGNIHTDNNGMQPYSTPVALTTEGVEKVIAGHVKAAQNAIAAGFDGVELHGAHGYLLEQFLHPVVNNRTDAYGGSFEKRAKIIVDIVQQSVAAIGKEKVGIRFSPFGSSNDLAPYDKAEAQATYTYLAQEMEKAGIAYIHLSMNEFITPEALQAIRNAYTGTIIVCNGLTPETALTTLDNGIADLVAFGKPYLANPDFDQRIAVNGTLNELDFTTLFSPGEAGYTDYPFLS